MPAAVSEVSAAQWLARHIPAWLRGGGNAADSGRVLLVLVGAIVVPFAPLLGPHAAAWRTLAALSAAVVAFAALSLRLPWQRWPASATLVFPVTALGGLALAGLVLDGAGIAYAGAIVLSFVYVGLFHRSVVGIALVPLAWLTYVALIGHLTTSIVMRLAVYSASWFAVSQVLAAMMAHQRVIVERLRRASRTDVLTALGNRRGLESHLADVVPGDCVAICDLDHFKAVNDASGHAVGDTVLARFGATIEQSMRRRDYAARYGGEEFVLILPRTSVAEATAVLAALGLAWSALGTDVTYSVGAAAAQPGQTGPAVLDAADSALYAAKAAGRNCVRWAGDAAPVPVGPAQAPGLADLPADLPVEPPGEDKPRPGC